MLLAFAGGESVLRAQVKAEMHNVMYHFTGPIAVHIIQLEGELEPTEPKATIVFDNANSFNISIRSAKISVTTDALSNVIDIYIHYLRDKIDRASARPMIKTMRGVGYRIEP